MKRYYNVHTHSVGEFSENRVDIFSVRLDSLEVSAPPSGYFSVGIHPYDVEKWGGSEQWLVKLKELAGDARCVAIGECGIDKRIGDVEMQTRLFTAQCYVAEELGLPVVAHCVKAQNEVVKVLKDFDVPKIMHSYHKTSGALLRLSDLYFSLSGRDVKHSDDIDLAQILLETDEECSSMVNEFYKELAGRRGLAESEIIEAVEANVSRAFEKIKN